MLKDVDLNNMGDLTKKMKGIQDTLEASGKGG